MKPLLRILHIEDSKEDSELIERMLVENGLPCQVHRVESRSAVFDALEKEPIDLILADCSLPGFSGLRALEIAHALRPETPFVFVSGTIGEDTAIESLRNGAHRLRPQGRLSRLVPAVRRALAEAEERTLCRQLQQRLREAGRLEAISTLSNGIAHDFNNILTIILGHASLLSLEHQNPQRVLEIGATLSEAARRGSEIVQQLLAFARKSDGHVEPTDLNRCLATVLPALREKLPPGVELALTPGDGLPSILVDTHQLDRILVNLVANSVDAMSGGGRITLAADLVSAAAVPDLLPELAAERYVRLTVTDTGRGIDSGTREHVFEPFFTTKDRGPRHRPGPARRLRPDAGPRRLRGREVGDGPGHRHLALLPRCRNPPPPVARPARRRPRGASRRPSSSSRTRAMCASSSRRSCATTATTCLAPPTSTRRCASSRSTATR
ncbi:MAG: response regulator [Verrucomicrobiota bacterium]